jgi:hypothetical protein
MKLLIHGLDDEERKEAMKGFYKGRENWKKEIGDYISRLRKIAEHNISNLMRWNDLSPTGQGLFPLEKIEVKEMDGKKHGKSVWMLLVDFDFYEERDKVRRQKIYIPLESGWYMPEHDIPDFFKRNVGKSLIGRAQARVGE